MQYFYVGLKSTPSPSLVPRKEREKGAEARQAGKRGRSGHEAEEHRPEKSHLGTKFFFYCLVTCFIRVTVVSHRIASQFSVAMTKNNSQVRTSVHGMRLRSAARRPAKVVARIKTRLALGKPHRRFPASISRPRTPNLNSAPAAPQRHSAPSTHAVRSRSFIVFSDDENIYEPLSPGVDEPVDIDRPVRYEPYAPTIENAPERSDMRDIISDDEFMADVANSLNEALARANTPAPRSAQRPQHMESVDSDDECKAELARILSEQVARMNARFQARFGSQWPVLEISESAN